MRKSKVACATGLLIGVTGALTGQINLNRTPSREIGHPQLAVNSTAVSTLNPNLVEGRELYNPQSIALDTTVSPPIVYVSDLLNNRVLGWRNSSDFANGAKADFFIGQRDFFTTTRGGPGTSVSSGLSFPTGLAVDRNGNLYVIDAGNNRVLRFPRPASQTEQLPNLVIGQINLSCGACGQANSGGVSAKTVFLASGSGPFASGIAFDSQGNLWLTDSGNHRVLRYPAQALTANTPAADVVLGQLGFDAVIAPTRASVDAKTALVNPTGLAFDPSGRLYVSDSSDRVSVFQPNLTPFDTGRPALKVMGVLPPLAPGQQRPAKPNELEFSNPQGLFMIGASAGVVDSGNHRILIFDPFEVWPADGSSPHARGLGPVGQFGYSQGKSNRELPEPGRNTLSLPTAAVATATELFVVDSNNNRVLVFLTNQLGQNSTATRVLGQDEFHLRAPNLTEGREVNFVPGSGGADGAVLVDLVSDVPHLYIADTFNNRVLGFRDARRLRPGDKADIVIGQPDFQRTVVNYPSNDSDKPTAKSLYQPVGLVLDNDGNLYVADLGNGRVLRFRKPFDQPEPNFPAADLVLGQSDFTSKVQDATSRTMRSPYGVAFAGDNGLLVSDVGLNRVLLFSGKSTAFTNGMSASKVFGQPDFNSLTAGVDDNRMAGPRHLATDTDDRLYVADEGNSRVLIFDRAPAADSNPRAGTILRGPNPPNSVFGAPRGLFVSKLTGEIWVTEVNVGRLTRFPKFDDLFFQQNQSNLQIASNSAVAICQDGFGSLFTTEGTNRVAVYFPDLKRAVNAANYIVGRAVAPGTIVRIDGDSKFADSDVVNPDVKWPKSLNGVQVLVNDSPAPIYYVLTDKIAFLMPMNAPTSGTVEVQVVKQSTGQVLALRHLEMAPASPALFTLNGQGFGQIAAYNDDGTLNGPNPPASPISRGKFISLYGTGQGFIAGAPPDGEPAQGAIETDVKPRVIINNAFVPDADITYSGLAPGLVGLWQINLKIPDSVPPSSTITVFVQLRSINSPLPPVTTTIAVKQ